MCAPPAPRQLPAAPPPFPAPHSPPCPSPPSRVVQVAAQRGPGHHLDGVALFKWDLGALYALPILVFGFNSHPNVVAVFTELARVPRHLITSQQHGGPGGHIRYVTLLGAYGPKAVTHRLVGMIGVVQTALLLIWSGYVAVGAAGYVAYPATVGDNVLNTFPGGDALMQVSQCSTRSQAGTR